MQTRAYLISNGAVAKEKKEEAMEGGLALAQAVDASACKNEAFAELVVGQTLEARRAHVLLAKKVEMDLLLRIAGRSQITEAISLAGARNSARAVLILAGGRKTLDGFEASALAGVPRLRRGPLGAEEAERVEAAALLNAERG